MPAPEPLKEEKNTTGTTTGAGGATPVTTRTGPSKVGTDTRPGGAADMATAPDSDGKLAKLDTTALHVDVARLDEARQKLESAHERAMRPLSVDYRSRLDEVVIAAERTQTLVRRLDQHLGDLSLADVAAMKNPPQDTMKAIQRATAARAGLNALLLGFPFLKPPDGMPSELIDNWKSEARMAAKALGNLAQQLGNQALLYQKLNDIDDRARKKKEEEAAKAAELKANPEPGKEKTPEQAGAAPGKSPDDRNARDAKVVQNDRDFVVFERVELAGSGVIRSVLVHYRRGGKPEKASLGPVSAKEFATFEAGVDSRTASLDMASELVAKLKTRWARFDVDADAFQNAEAALAPALLRAFRTQQ